MVPTIVIRIPRSMPTINQTNEHYLWVSGFLLVTVRTTAAEKQFRERADVLNNEAAGHFPPLFGLRYPGGGGIQLIYGTDGNEIGVDKSDPKMEELHKALQKEAYVGANWRSL